MRLKLLLQIIFVAALSAKVHAQTNQITLKVNMSGQVVSPNGVHVAGAFQGWDPSSTPMIDEGNGIFSHTFTADEFANLNFKFINGNDWPFQESVPSGCGLPDGFGGFNRILETGGSDVVYGPYCFGECEDCSTTVEPTFVNVLFQVNMANEVVSPQGVHIAGNFQDWNPNGTVMNEVGAGIYELSYEVEANSTLEFRFINGSEWGDSEVVPQECGIENGFGQFNRTLEIGSSNEVFGPVCFSGCANCVPSIPVMIIFQVDMTNEDVSSDGVFVAGTFNDWNPTATQLAPNGDGTYAAVVFVDANSEVSYKFLNGNAWESVPMECGISDGFGGFNRSLSVIDQTVTTDLVCFNSCASCVIIPTVSLTLRVDMTNEEISAQGVHVAGSFNNFSATSTTMEAEGNGIYSATVEIPENTVVSFKYINGNDWINAEMVPFECGVNDGFGGYNRNFVTNNSDITLPVVCFSSCQACIVNVNETNVESLLSAYPNPATDMITIMGLDSHSQVEICDVTGKIFFKGNPTGASLNVDVSAFPQGIYLLRDLQSHQSARLIVQ